MYHRLMGSRGEVAPHSLYAGRDEEYNGAPELVRGIVQQLTAPS